MNGLPPSWVDVEIVEVLEPSESGKPFQQGWSPQCENTRASEGAWGVLKTTAIQHGEFWPHENKALPASLKPRPHIEVRSGDILMTCAGPRNRCGVACLVEHTPPRLLMSGKMYRFRPHPKALHPKYLAYLIQRREAQLAIDQMKTGISDSGLNLTHDRFAQLRVALAPLPEQRRIVAKIEELFSELDASAESLTRARALLKTYRQSLLKAAFEGKLTADWRAANDCEIESAESHIRNIEAAREKQHERALKDWKTDVAGWSARDEPGRRPQKPRTAEVAEARTDEFEQLSALPRNWEWCLLSQLAGHIVDGTHKTPSYQAAGIPFISAKDINGFRVNFSHTRFITREEHDDLSARCRVRRGNVLITKSGTIGRVAVVETDEEFSLFESVANVPLSSLANSRYVAFASSHIIESYFGSSQQKGVAVRHLHLEDLRRVPIPLCGRREQDALVERLDMIFSSVEAIESEINGAVLKVSSLRQSILKRAFSGRLVPQDPSDEPAAALLARLRDEPAAPARKTRRKQTA